MEKQLPGTSLEPEEMAEMVLKKALSDYRKAQIEKEIDESLRNRDKEEFLRLTEILKGISWTLFSVNKTSSYDMECILKSQHSW